MSNDQKIILLRETFPWMGSHSGYDLICDYINNNEEINSIQLVKIAKKPGTILKTLYLYLERNIKKSVTYSAESFLAELEIVKKNIIFRTDIVHLIYVERMLGVLAKFPEFLRGKIVGTVHQPMNLWLKGRHNPEMVKQLEALIVLSHKEKDFFEKFIPGNVHFIRHGVDTDFFCPTTGQEEKQKIQRPRCLFSGIWLRDIGTLHGVVERVLQRNSGIHFDLLIPIDRRDEPHFEKLKKYSQVHWHAGLTDEELRELYRSASLLLLPLHDCTANNALLEGVSCGLPVVSNDVGGVPDYTEPDFADLFPIGDAESMSEAVLAIVDDFELRQERGLKARAYAKSCLDWKHIAQETVHVYEEFL